jgi:hypothetical protein
MREFFKTLFRLNKKSRRGTAPSASMWTEVIISICVLVSITVYILNAVIFRHLKIENGIVTIIFSSIPNLIAPIILPFAFLLNAPELVPLKVFMFYVILVMAGLILVEALGFFGIVSNTFDVYDIVFSFIGSLAAIFLYAMLTRKALPLKKKS